MTYKKGTFKVIRRIISFFLSLSIFLCLPPTHARQLVHFGDYGRITLAFVDVYDVFMHTINDLCIMKINRIMWTLCYSI